MVNQIAGKIDGPSERWEPITVSEIGSKVHLDVNVFDSGIGIASGSVIGVSGVSKFGANPGLAQDAHEDVWDVSGLYTFPTTATIASIVAESALDDIGSTGAGSIVIDGLDADYNIQTETLSLNGTTTIFSTGSYIRVHRMYITSAGDIGSNLGSIIATVDGNIVSQITERNNQTLQAIYTIPAGKTGYLQRWYGTMNTSIPAGTDGDFHLQVRAFGQVFQLKHLLGVNDDSSGAIDHVFSFPLRLNEKSDVKMQGHFDTADVGITGGFDITLIDNIGR